MIPAKIDRRAAIVLIEILLACVMSTILGLQPGMSQSPHERINTDSSLRSETASWKDSLNRLNPRTRPVYAGFDISLGAPQYRLNSNIAVLNSLPVNYFGGMVGGVLANPVGKLKGGIGLYYSGENVPYTFDLLAANITANLYLLRIKEVRYHTLEPYLLSGISQMNNKFYGYYLSDPSTRFNHTSLEAPHIGSVFSTQLLAGTGVEYQLENENGDFIHLYVELSFATNVHTSATTDALSGSEVPRSLWVTVGVSFGKFK